MVLCHGVGADGHDLIDLAPHWAPDLPDTAFAAPDAPEPFDGAPFGRQWWAIGDRDPARMAAGAAAARPRLDAFIDAELARLALPPDAYALVGFSQGAMMVLFAGLRRSVAAARDRRVLRRAGGAGAAGGPKQRAPPCCWCTGKRTTWCPPSARAMRKRRCGQRAFPCSSWHGRGWATASTRPGWLPAPHALRRGFAM